MIARITALPGDGIGPEVTRQALVSLNAVGEKFGHRFETERADVGGAALDACGCPLPEATLALCRAADAVLLGAVGGPRWDAAPPGKRPESGLLALRGALGVYANLRPARLCAPLAAACPLSQERAARGFDLLIVRELTGDAYFGEKWVSEDGGAACDMMRYGRDEVRRVARVAFEFARGRRKKLASVDKANVLASSRLWRAEVRALSEEYPDVELTHMYVDNAAMQLIAAPAQFDVIVTGNLFGDILSDEAGALTGSIGMLPSASLGARAPALYEPVHGSAPDIAGRDIANPLGAILSAAMLLRHSLSLTAEADALERAVQAVLGRGLRTADIACGDAAQTRVVGTRAMGEAVAQTILCE